jgi:hypothetical protein
MTLGRFFPEQLGGDGSYVSDNEFLTKIWRISGYWNEIVFRVERSLAGQWTQRYVKSDKPIGPS